MDGQLASIKNMLRTALGQQGRGISYPETPSNYLGVRLILAPQLLRMQNG